MNISNLSELGVSLLLEIWLLSLLIRRGVRQQVPVFVAFTCVSACATAARLLSVSHYQTYFLIFWSGEAFFLLFGLAALNEVFHKVYEGFFRLRWFQWVYYGAIALVLLLTIWKAIAEPPVQASPLIGLILDLGIAVNLLQLCIAALFGALANPLGIGFWRYPFGIAAGFAVSSAGPAIGYLARSVFGTKVNIFTQNASAVAYILALVIWVATFAWPEPEEKAWTPPVPPEEMLRIVRGYLRALGVGKNDDEA